MYEVLGCKFQNELPLEYYAYGYPIIGTVLGFYLPIWKEKYSKSTRTVLAKRMHMGNKAVVDKSIPRPQEERNLVVRGIQRNEVHRHPH